MVQKRTVWILLSSFILIIILASMGLVWNILSARGTPPVSSTPESKTQYQGQGVAYGIQETREGKYWHTYRVPEHSSFRGFFYLLNQRPAEEYLLTCLVDYRQVPCTFDGQQQLLYRVSIEDFGERTLPFETPTLAPGLHDLAILAFAKPTVHDLSREYRLSTDFNYLYAPRAVLLAGDEPWQTPSIEYTITGTRPTNKISPLEGLVINREEQELEIRAWITQEVRSGESTEYFVHLGNDTGPSHTRAVMAFLDYKQIPLAGADQWVAYVSLPTGTRAVLPGRFVAPQEVGVHELVVVFAYDPFHMLEEPPLGSDRDLTQFSAIVESSIRVAIIVVE
ncbi:MAG: hypothetical protein P8186_17865 [Anaerolineae bacterium]